MKRMNKKKIKARRRKKKRIPKIIYILFFIVVLVIVAHKKTKTEQEALPVASTNNVNVAQNEVLVAIVEEPEDKIEKEIDSNTTDWNLILVNKNNPIPENYVVNVEKVEGNAKADSRIITQVKNMLNDAREQGLDPIICSSYRTHDYQKYLFNRKVNYYRNLGYSYERSQDLASGWVSIPGTSEHELGLSLDIVSRKYQILDEKQENTQEQKWLMENSYKYGFVLRYPTSKKDITMINYEPWHYRYVGIENATFMKERDMCLEEYIDYLKQFE